WRQNGSKLIALPRLIRQADNFRFAQSLEKELKAALQKKDQLPLFEDIDNLIDGLRKACESTIFDDFEFATQEGVEGRLWDAHSLINSRYRKLHQHYQKVDQNKKVEKRKLDKRYVDFLKTSQFFYKGYIQRLASCFTGLTGLRRIAHCLSLSTLSADERVQVAPRVERLIEVSCHAALLHLGDLSRYRNEIRIKDRSWESSIAYYRLAGDLCPNSGSSHNQMAVIALADGNHLDVLYNLYRAIACNEPHPAARKNLEVEFKKITTSWERNAPPPTRKDSEATLILWFVRLHAKLYKGEEFSTYDELESEVLSRLALLLKEQSFEVTLEKFVLTNIAAEYFAALRVQGKPFQFPAHLHQITYVEMNSSINIQSFYFFLRLNVRMFFILLQVLLPELDDPVTGEDLPNPSNENQSNRAREKITAIARRILPALRQYNTWLVSEARILVANHPGSTSVYIREFWKMYADVTTALATYFPVNELPNLDYLLEEDQTTVGFKPFRDPSVERQANLYIDEEGLVKARCTDPGVERSHPNVEMKARVRDILLCGLTLATREDCPLIVDNGRIVYVEGGLQQITPTAVQGSISPHTGQSNKISNLATPDLAQQEDKINPEGSVGVSESQQSMDTDMHRMVDDLLEPPSEQFSASNETSYGAIGSHTFNEIFANPTLQHIHQTPRVLPALPPLWNSPFTPQPNELQPSSPDRPTTARQLSPLQLSTPQEQLEAAAALDQMTGYTTYKNSWGRKSSRPHEFQTSAPVNQLLQQSLAQQFRPKSTSSSAFSDSSSIYVNSTARHETRIGGGATGGTLRSGPISKSNGNNTSNTTIYPGASNFDKDTMLQSSLWPGSENAWGNYASTPPGGQGG
ncbi:smg-7, partial [Hyphodiscus hymeniophilus]